MAVQFSKRAAVEFDEIFKRILEFSRDDREYAEQVSSLANELQKLAANPLLGTPLRGAGMEDKFKWLIGSQNQWIIYFLRPNPDSIVIMRVRGAKMAPLTSKEIEKAFKRRL
jgi:plasmid stabilization system protein ParE